MTVFTCEVLTHFLRSVHIRRAVGVGLVLRQKRDDTDELWTNNISGGMSNRKRTPRKRAYNCLHGVHRHPSFSRRLVAPLVLTRRVLKSEYRECAIRKKR